MNHRSALRMLLWKDTRQLVPLVVGLLILGTLLIAASSLVPAGTLGGFSGTELLLLAVPSMFAIGAGALMVGQEKELRTMQWLNSLPIRPPSILASKLIVGLSALVILWVTSSLLQLLGNQAGGLGRTLDPAAWIVHSVFLLFVGFTLAWYFQSAFQSLLALSVVSCIPLLVSLAISTYIDEGEFPWILIAVTAIAAIGFAVLSWRVGLHALGPASAPSIRAVNASAKNLASEDRLRGAEPAQPLAALAWQAFTQSRVAFLCLGLFLTFAVVLASLADETLGGRSMITGLLSMLAIFGSWLSVCWLGVLVFQGDELAMRKRFLADRGIAPWRVWLTRQQLPLALICTFSLLGGLAFNASASTTLLPQIGANAFWLPVLAVPLAAFCMSQWLSHCISSPIVAYICAPLVAAATVVYLIFCWFDLESPLWLLFIPLVISLAVTFLTSRQWLDHDRTWRLWLPHGLALVLAALIPCIPAAVKLVQMPRISSATLRELMPLASQPAGPKLELFTLSQLVPVSQVVAGESQSSDDSTLDNSVGDGEAPKTEDSDTKPSPAEILQGLQRKPLALLSVWQLVGIAADMRLTRMRGFAGERELGNNELIERYRTEADILLLQTERWRSNPVIQSQDVADRLELIWLEELKSPESRQLLSVTTGERILTILRDKKARVAARKKAIAYSLLNTRDGDIGDYYLYPNSNRITLIQSITSRAAAGALCEQLLRQLNASSMPGVVAAQNAIREQLGLRPTTAGHLQEISEAIAIDGPYQCPGQLWGLSWEDEAAELPSTWDR